MRYLILIVAILAIITIAGCEFPDPVGVGAYKGPTNSWDYMQTYKEYGHQGYEIYSPTPEIAGQYCSLCHYVN